MKYLVAVHKDPDTGFGVTIPDVTGCFSYGDTFEEALDNAKEALAEHLEILAEDGVDIPIPGDQAEHLANPDFEGALWAFIDLDPYDYMGKAKRINVTMPGYALKKIDDFVERHTKDHDRSKFLLRAAMSVMEKEARLDKGKEEDVAECC